jgi:hypothetical protein
MWSIGRMLLIACALHVRMQHLMLYVMVIT